MEDLNFFENVFNVIKVIWGLLFVASVFAILMVLNSLNTHEPILFLLWFVGDLLTFGIGFVLIKIFEILLIRFVSATESINQIAALLEKHFK